MLHDRHDVTTYTSFWLDSYADEAGIYWYQAIGWPQWWRADCELAIVCTNGYYNYNYRDNFPAHGLVQVHQPVHRAFGGVHRALQRDGPVH